MSKAWKKVKKWTIDAAKIIFTGGLSLVYDWYKAQQPDEPDTPTSEPSDRTLRSSKAPVRFILGRAATGGVLAWGQEQAGEQTDGEWLHMVYVLSEGAIDGVEAIYLNEELISTYGDHVNYEVVINPTEPNAYLLANSPDWRDTQIGRGLSYVRISFKYSGEKFQQGIPDVRFVVRGIPVYDPRTGASVHSENTALQILWFLRERCGVPDDEIIMESFAAAANVCAETVINPDGTTSPRYRSSCVIGADERRTDVLKKLTASCAGNLIRVGGKWSLQVGAYYGPADFIITENMVIGTVAGAAEVSNDEAINVIRGTFCDPSQSWQDTDYPEVSVAEWLIEDGGESAESLDFKYVTDVYQAQRLANIELRKRRTGGMLKLPMNFAGYNCRPGRVVNVSLPSLNINGEFIVTDWSMSAEDACSVTLEQYSAGVFDDAVGVPYNPLGFIALPTGGLAAPTGLQWSAQFAAEVAQGVLSWTPPIGVVDYYSVTVRLAGSAVMALQVPGHAAQCQINGLDAGDYEFSITAQGPSARSGEAAINVSIQGPPAPETCAVYAGNLEITLVPSNIQRRLNGGTYEFYVAPNAETTASGAVYLGQGLSFTHTGLSFNTPYHYHIRSRNAYGVSAFLYVPTRTSADVSAMLDALTDQITESQLGQYLSGEIEKISGSGAGSVDARLGDTQSALMSQINAIQAQLADITGAPDYVPGESYLAGALVRYEGAIYQAKANVPAGIPPTDTLYWTKVGEYASIGEAVAAISLSLDELTTTVTQQGGVITSQGESINALASRVEDAETGVAGNADAISAVANEVELLDGKVTSTASSLDLLTASVRPERADGSKADALKGWGSQASYANQVVVQATAEAALARQITTLEATVREDIGAAVQEVTQAVADLDGKASTMWAVKMQVNQAGQYVYAGVGLGIENQGGVLQSNFLIQADQFQVMNNINGTPTSVFAIVDGQVYIRSAVIQQADILNLIVTGELRSPDYVAGTRGVRINFASGDFELNSQFSGGGRQVINSAGGKVYDQTPRLRYQWGDLRA